MDNIKRALDSLKRGGIVVFPTDTAYGIGCSLSDEEAVSRLYTLRRRPINKAVPVLVGSLEMAKKYFRSDIPRKVSDLMRTHWPGGLTIIYYCKKELVPESVRAGGETVGLRMPDNKLILKIINELGEPILGPSANFSGKPTPFSYSELDDYLKKSADFVLRGKCKTKQASTVVDVTSSEWKILRQGSVKLNI